MHNFFYDERHEAFRAIVREFVRFEVGPSYRHWDQAREVPLELYARLGEAGCIGLTIPEKFGGFGELAEIETELSVTRAYLERCIFAMNDGDLNTVDAAKAKWWATELEQRVVTRCLQLHGGNGFLEDYPIGRAFRDSRVQSIYGGTTEIMKEIIARDIARRAQP